MGFLSQLVDGAVALFSPKEAAARQAWRERMRSYDAATDERLNAGWRVASGPAESVNGWSRGILRNRGRDLERNSDITNAVIASKVRNIIGAGFSLQARTKNARINNLIEEQWRIWTKARNCDVTGVQSLTQMLSMAVRRKTVDGGILFVKRYTPHGSIRFSLQALEVDDLDNGQMAPMHQGNRVIGGIEYSRYNRPVGYWITTYEPDGFTLNQPQYVEAKDVIFYFAKRRPSQVREVSDMAPMMTRIRDANEFIVAVAVKQRIEACLAVFIKRALPTPDNFGRSRMMVGKDGKISYEHLELGPGLISELDIGDEIQVVNPTGQASDASSFLKMFQRLIASGFGLSYESVSRDLSETNYSSARQGAIEDELTFAEDREQITAILDEIYETFIISLYLNGYLPADTIEAVREKYFPHEWIQRPKPWIDPLKEANAQKIALQNGLKTFQQLAAENGMDWQDQLDQIIEAAEYGQKKGYDVTGLLYDGRLVKPAEAPEPQSEVQPEQPEQPEKEVVADGA